MAHSVSFSTKRQAFRHTQRTPSGQAGDMQRSRGVPGTRNTVKSAPVSRSNADESGGYSTNVSSKFLLSKHVAQVSAPEGRSKTKTQTTPRVNCIQPSFRLRIHPHSPSIGWYHTSGPGRRLTLACLAPRPRVFVWARPWSAGAPAPPPASVTFIESGSWAYLFSSFSILSCPLPPPQSTSSSPHPP